MTRSTGTRAAARTYGGRTGEERRAERRGLLLDAATGLVRDRGLVAVGVRPVCRASGLTERYFYESFAGVDELLAAVFDAQLSASAELVTTAVAAADGTPEAVVRAAVAAFVDLVTRDPLPGRLLVESASHPALAARRRTAIDTFVDLIVATGTALVGPPPDDRARRRSRRLAVALVGGLHELLTQWLAESAEPVQEWGSADELGDELVDELVDDMVALFLASLGPVRQPG